MIPTGLSVPSSKINCISRRFRLVLLPLHCLTPQTLMSSIVWLAELKCSATGSPGDRLRMLRRCSPKRSRRRLPVSPMYMLMQRRQVMQYTTFSDWLLKRFWMVCDLLGPCRTVWEVMYWHVWQRGRRQGKEPAARGLLEPLIPG